MSINTLFILTCLWVFIIIILPFYPSTRSEWVIEMHILFAIDYIHNLLKAFCSAPVMSAGLQEPLNLKHFERAHSLIKATDCRVACRFMNKNHVCFWKRNAASASAPSPTVKLCSHSALSLTAIVSRTIKSRKKRKRKKILALIKSSGTGLT